MNILFKTNNKNVVNIKVDNIERKILDIEVFEGKEKMVLNYLPRIKNQTYDDLEKLIEYYLDAENSKLNLEDYLIFIKENGFYSPYKENLRIEILE